MSYLNEVYGLDGKVAAVVGGYGVLGAAMAQGLARAGARVAILGPDGTKAQEQASVIADRAAVEVVAVRTDATQKEDLLRAREWLYSLWGGLDILVNAAGINSDTAFLDIGVQEWNDILAVNLQSTFLACQVFGEEMIKEGGGGSIVNVSSACSDRPLSKVSTYGVSKAGVDNLTGFLAREWAPHKVRVNAIAPGFFPAKQSGSILSEERVKTIMQHTPMGRFGRPDELVGTLLWLASERASSFVTGAVVRVDGGFTSMSI